MDIQTKPITLHACGGNSDRWTKQSLSSLHVYTRYTDHMHVDTIMLYVFSNVKQVILCLNTRVVQLHVNTYKMAAIQKEIRKSRAEKTVGNFCLIKYSCIQ